MYILRKLIEEANVLYYKEYKNTSLLPLPKFNKINIKHVQHNVHILDKFERFSKINYIYHDIYSLLQGFGNLLSESGMKYMTMKRNMENKIQDKLPSSYIFHQVKVILVNASEESYIVGGFVRDVLLDKDSKDIDFVTDTPYKKLKELFSQNGFTVKEKGEEFLVMIVSKENENGDSENYDIANFRKDSKSSDSRHPDYVEIGDINDDSHRRDFCVNSLYYNISNEHLYDPTSYGIEDIINKQLRFIGNPKDRLDEDALRLWRAYRLSITKGLELERRTEKALREHFKMCYDRSNPARVLQEIIKMKV